MLLVPSLSPQEQNVWKLFPNPLSHRGSVTSSLLLSPAQNNNGGEKAAHNSQRRTKIFVREDVNDGGVTKNTTENEIMKWDHLMRMRTNQK